MNVEVRDIWVSLFRDEGDLGTMWGAYPEDQVDRGLVQSWSR